MSTGTVSVTIEWRAKALQAIKLTRPASLAALWSLGEGPGESQAADASGSDLHGTHSAGVALGKHGIGDGSLAALYGGSDYTHVYSAGLASAFNPNAGALLGWFRVTDSAVLTDGATRVLARLAADGNNEVLLYKDTANNTFGGRCKAGGVSSQRTFTMNNTGKHWLGITWNKSLDRARVYLDGAQQGADLTGLGTWAGALASALCVLGAQDNGGTNGHKGLLSTWALYDTELTPAEMAEVAGHLTRFDDVSADTLKFRSKVGFAQRDDRVARVGTAALTLDDGFRNSHGLPGLYSPFNASSPLYGALDAARADYPLPFVTVVETFGGTAYPLFTGKVVEVVPDPARFEVQVKCVDAMHDLSVNEVALPLYEGVTTDALARTIANKSGPPRAAQPGYLRVGVPGQAEIGFAKIAAGTEGMDFDAGYETLNFAGDGWLSGPLKAIRALTDVASAEWGRLWAAPDGTLKLWNRYHEIRDTTAQAALSGSMKGVRLQKDLTESYNEVAVTVRPRQVGGAGTLLGTSQNKPALHPYESITLDLHFRDPEGGRRIAARTVMEPVRGVDFVANSAQDGSGADQSGNVSVALAAYATFARLTVTNNVGISLYMTTLQVRGTPLYTYDEQTVVASGPSLTRRRKTIALAVGDETEFARQLSDNLFGLWQDPAPAPLVTLENHSDALYTHMLARGVMDLVTLVETQTGLDGDYRIVGVEHEKQGAYHRTLWQTAPYNPAAYFVVGAGRIGVGRVGPF